MQRRKEAIIWLMALSLLALPHRVVAASLGSDIIITELQTAGSTASEEFIELYNTTDKDIDLADSSHQGKSSWKLQFFSSTKVVASGFGWDPKTSGLTTVNLVRSDGSAMVVAAHSYFLITTAPNGVPYAPDEVSPDFTYGSGHMSDTGGGVQLVDSSGSGSSLVANVHDHLGWYQPTATVGLPTGFYVTPASGASLQRHQSETEPYASQPFISSDILSPNEAWSPPLEVVAEPQPEAEPDTEETPTTTVINTGQQAATPPPDDPMAVQLSGVMITELLPNPKAPQTDDKDEYIELYNATDQLIDLTGYTLQTGMKFSYSYKLPQLTLDPHSYTAVASASSSLSLANSAGQARLLDKNAQVVSQTQAYGTAVEGEAWALVGTTWMWTATPTPAAANIATTPVPKTTSKTSATKANTTSSAKSAKATTPKSTKTTKADSKVPANTVNEKEPNKEPPLHPLILAAIGTAALVYAVYEYRTDAKNAVRKLRSYRAARRAARAQA